jgi:hypothetical protein
MCKNFPESETVPSGGVVSQMVLPKCRNLQQLKYSLLNLCILCTVWLFSRRRRWWGCYWCSPSRCRSAQSFSRMPPRLPPSFPLRISPRQADAFLIQLMLWLKITYLRMVINLVSCSVRSLWHFGADPDPRIPYLLLMDPDPTPDPTPFFSDFKDAKNIFFS